MDDARTNDPREVSPITRRVHARWPVAIEARLTIDGSALGSNVVDISAGGARVTVSQPLPRGIDVDLDLAPFDCFEAHIAWCGGGFAGLQFHVDPDHVSEVLQAMAVYRVEPQPTKPVLDRRRRAKETGGAKLEESAKEEPGGATAKGDTQSLEIEIRDLKATISALRDELEKAHYGRDEAVEQAASTSRDETRQLQDTISAMRDELERERFDKAQAIESAVTTANDEIKQLRNTAAALRDELEGKQVAHEDRVQEMERAFRDEKLQLTETIAVLRDRLEELSSAAGR